MNTPAQRMSQPQFYVQRNGFRETLMVVVGEDADGYPVEREATVDEQHDAWVADRGFAQ